MKQSNWDVHSIETLYGSSYYNFGRLDYMDHLLEASYIKPYVAGRSDLTALDLACGNGRFTELLSPYCKAIDAVDLENRHLEIVASRVGNNVRTVLADALDFVKSTPTTYDVVVIGGLLLFLDAETSLDLINSSKKILKKNGIIIIRDFISHSKDINIKSSVFPDTTLYYKNRSFYEKCEFGNFSVSRPRHNLPNFEKATMGWMPYGIYSALWSQPVRKLSWSRAPYANYLMTFASSHA